MAACFKIQTRARNATEMLAVRWKWWGVCCVRGWQGFQRWEEGCGEGVGGVCRGEGSYRGAWVVAHVQLCQGKEMLPFPSRVPCVLRPHTSHFTHGQSWDYKPLIAAKPVTGWEPLRCCSNLGMGTSLQSCRCWRTTSEVTHSLIGKGKEEGNGGRDSQHWVHLQQIGISGGLQVFPCLALSLLVVWGSAVNHTPLLPWVVLKQGDTGRCPLPTHINFSLWSLLAPRACRQEQHIVGEIQLVLHEQALPWLGSFCCDYSSCERWKAKWISKWPKGLERGNGSEWPITQPEALLLQGGGGVFGIHKLWAHMKCQIPP